MDAIPLKSSEAWKKLEILAKTPVDLTNAATLTADRILKYRAKNCGYSLLYGFERIDDNVMKALLALGQERQVFNNMESMQAGAIVNVIQGYPSENRSALHTATRDFFDRPNLADAAAQAAKQAKAEVDKLKAFTAQLDREKRFTDLILVGIGGSDLGPRANYIALSHLKQLGRNVHFISNVDPDDAAEVLQGINLSKSLVAVVSKSGTTLETATNEELVRSQFKKAGLSPEHHFIAVTGQGSPMDNPKKYRQSFYIWDWIGGRYSSTSMVGGVILAFAYGFDVYWEFLRGANAMDKAALVRNLSENLPLLAALLGIWNHNFLGSATQALIPYSQGLLRYPAHIQQVDMESNGKRIDRSGNPIDCLTSPVLWGEPGTNAQHSFFQMIHQGTEVIPVQFVAFKSSRYGEDVAFKGTTSQQKLLANVFAQAIALATGKTDNNPNKVFPGNRPSHIILGKQLTPYALGALLSFFEHKAAFQGFVWGINSFDQEGVQLGKVLAGKILDRFASRNAGTAGEIYPLGDALIKQLDDKE